MADPAPVAQTFFVDDTVQASYVLDAIVTVVDAKHAQVQLSEHHEAQEQVGFADRVLMSKVDLVSREEASQLAARLRQMNPRAPIRPVHFGETDLKELLDIRSFDLNAIIDIEPDFLADLAHEHDDDVTSFVYCTKVPLDRDKVEEFFSEMVATYGPAMLRYKGMLDIHGVDRRTVFQGVHMIFGANIDKPWGGIDERETKIVFIGKQLPADLFRLGLDNCMIREDLRQ
ncbi:CobW family GTP-binding protein [Paraburkholderia atlantica]|uniref:CobW family GTP-binding protein n=1 Tax=Paraburkholderia atlantica TaxID=2654982 RepID=UPI003D210B53